MIETFDDLGEARVRNQGSCPICEREYEKDEAGRIVETRGRVQVVIRTWEPYKPADHRTAAEKDQHNHKVRKDRAIASETRIACESCSVGLYKGFLDQLPARQKKRGDKQ